jgi:hypothetical protein
MRPHSISFKAFSIGLFPDFLSSAEYGESFPLWRNPDNVKQSTKIGTRFGQKIGNNGSRSYPNPRHFPVFKKIPEEKPWPFKSQK